MWTTTALTSTNPAKVAVGERDPVDEHDDEQAQQRRATHRERGREQDERACRAHSREGSACHSLPIIAPGTIAQAMR